MLIEENIVWVVDKCVLKEPEYRVRVVAGAQHT